MTFFTRKKKKFNNNERDKTDESNTYTATDLH